jgi:hypothetical protein
MPYYGPDFSKKVDSIFRDDGGKEFAQTYLREVLTNWRDVESRLRHTALLAFVAAVFGEFLTYGHVAQIELAGLTIRGLPIFQKAIPVVVAYLIYDFCNLIVVTSSYFGLSRELLLRLNDGMRGGLATAVVPPVSLFLGEESWTDFYGEGPSEVLVLILGLIRPFIVIGAPLAYIIQQFMHLAAIKQADALFWICAGLTALLIMASLAVVFSWLRAEHGNIP